MIIQLVIKDFTPQQICAELALCPSVEVAPEIVLTKQDTECLFCEFVMRNIDDLMANATTDAQIIDALDQVCNALPTHLQGKCIKFVDKYGNTVIDFLTHNLHPSKFANNLPCALNTNQTLNSLTCFTTSMRSLTILMMSMTTDPIVLFANMPLVKLTS